jgi:hypothetical protein
MDCVDLPASTVALRDPDFAAAIDHVDVAPCYARWCEAWQDGRLPLHRVVRPPFLPACTLPYLFLYERRGERFLCRLTGTLVDSVFGTRHAGRYLDEMLDGVGLTSRTALMQRVLRDERGLLYGGNLAAQGREHIPFRRLLLPLADATGRASFVFGAVWFNDSNGEPLRQPARVTSEPELVLYERPR